MPKYNFIQYKKTFCIVCFWYHSSVLPTIFALYAVVLLHFYALHSFVLPTIYARHSFLPTVHALLSIVLPTMHTRHFFVLLRVHIVSTHCREEPVSDIRSASTMFQVVTWEWMSDKCKLYLITVQGMLSNQTEICNNKGIIFILADEKWKSSAN